MMSPWPPDLSPIEQIWTYIKAKIQLSHCVETKPLFQEGETIWNSSPMDMINNYSNSFKPRIGALEDLKGKSLVVYKLMI
jgi:abortive infection bacteriophage resistance protein